MDKKEKKKSKNKTQKKLEDLKETMTGFLIFTDKNKEKNSIKDAYNILNEVIEELYPNLFKEEKKNEEEKTNIDKLDSELNKIKNTKKFFYNFDTHCKGVVFIKVDKEYKNIIYPKECIIHIFNKIKEDKESISKFITKFLPIEIAMQAKIEMFKEKGKEIIVNFFNNINSENKKSWKIEFRCRNNNSIYKNDYLNFIFGLIDKDKFYVDYKKPDYTILIEITNNLLCLSILEKYSEYKNYNIQSLSKSEEELNKEREKLIKIQQEKLKEKEMKKINEKDKKEEEKKEEKEKEKEEEEEEKEEEIDLI